MPASQVTGGHKNLQPGTFIRGRLQVAKLDMGVVNQAMPEEVLRVHLSAMFHYLARIMQAYLKFVCVQGAQ